MSGGPEDKKRKERTVRVPNPEAPVKERLDAPARKVHRSKKAYRRKPKHPGREGE